MAHISRRDFLKASGVVAAGAVLSAAGCTVEPETTLTPIPSTTHIPTHTPRPTATATPAPPTRTPAVTATARRREIMRMYPDAASKVVHTRHSGVWSGGTLAPGALEAMLDASITRLTGLNDAHEAWSALFDPGERIAIKVNTIQGSVACTPVPLVMAVVKKLQEIGVPDRQILIYDRGSYELENAGFSINQDGPGAICQGTDQRYTQGFTISKYQTGLSDLLLGCDALINMPLLKQHMFAGITFALKNHYGTIDLPGRYHSDEAINNFMPGISALKEIKDRTRLVIGSTLETALGDSWYKRVEGDAILMSFDPLAHDTVGLDLFRAIKREQGEETQRYEQKAQAWLRIGNGLGVGATDPEQFELLEVDLS